MRSQRVVSNLTALFNGNAHENFHWEWLRIDTFLQHQSRTAPQMRHAHDCHIVIIITHNIKN
jgi:hypothetical protein